MVERHQGDVDDERRYVAQSRALMRSQCRIITAVRRADGVTDAGGSGAPAAAR